MSKDEVIGLLCVLVVFAFILGAIVENRILAGYIKRLGTPQDRRVKERRGE